MAAAKIDPAPPPAAHSPAKRSLLLLTGGGALATLAILFVAVLPAEYDIDPTGLGKATGLARLWAPKEVMVAAVEGAQPLAREYATPYRTDVLEIPLTSNADPNGAYELEYKVRMKKGSSLVYSWSMEGAPPTEFYYDFHGHTPPLPPKGEVQVSTYKKANDGQANGMLTAPFDGIHGWYFQNQSLKPAVVHLRISGFYDLIAPGEEGNEAGLVSKPAP